MPLGDGRSTTESRSSTKRGPGCAAALTDRWSVARFIGPQARPRPTSAEPSEWPDGEAGGRARARPPDPPDAYGWRSRRQTTIAVICAAGVFPPVSFTAVTRQELKPLPWSGKPFGAMFGRDWITWKSPVKSSGAGGPGAARANE